jgi:hypothetical protein
MKDRQVISRLSILVVILVFVNAGIGLFYSDGGSPRYVESIHGETVQLFGDGIYANHSTFVATIRKGTDFVMLFVAVGLLLTTIKRNIGDRMRLLHCGLLVSLLYYSATLAFETMYNQLFLLYTAMLSVTFFAFLFTMIDLHSSIKPASSEGKHTKTAIFTILSGCTVFVWLMDVIPSIFTGIHPDFVSIYTTSPTIIIDVGLIFPICVMGGVMLLRKKTMGYVLPPIMLIFLSVIAVTVIGQTAFQMAHGVYVPAYQLVGYVGTFMAFGFIAMIVNVRFMKKCWPSLKQSQKTMEH